MRNQKNKSALMIGTALFCVLAILMGIVWAKNRPETEQGEKGITVEVIHKDGTEAEFAYQTDHEYLSEVLLEEGLIAGTVGEYGLYVETIDGETAVYSADGGWWQLSSNREVAQTGTDHQVLHDGDVYTWTYMMS